MLPTANVNKMSTTLRIVGSALAMAVFATAWAEARYPVNPTITDNAIYVGQHGVTCFDLTSLKPRWTALPDRFTDAPVVVDGVVLVGSRSGLYALDLDGGALLWRIPSSARLFSPSAANGMAYVGGEDGSLRAVAVATGKVLWLRRFAGWIYPPAIVDNRLVVGGKAHRLYGLVADSGDILWEVPLNQESVYRPVAIGNGNVVVTTFAGEILALAAADGSRRWQVQESVANLSPVVANEHLYFRTFSGLLKVRSQTDGALRWQAPLQDLLDHPIQIYREWVVATNDVGRLTVLHAETGQQLAQYDTQSRPFGTPGLSDDQIVLFTDGGGTQPWPRSTVVTWATLQLEERR